MDLLLFWARTSRAQSLLPFVESKTTGRGLRDLLALRRRISKSPKYVDDFARRAAFGILAAQPSEDPCPARS